MNLPVKDLKGEVVAEMEASDALFGAPLNGALVHQVMVAQQANRRAGTHATKRRGEVRGGGRKPWPQKHTGRARQGSIRAPQWRHGGIVFGPQPRDYHQRIPRKMRHQALRCLLSQKVRDGDITVVQDLALPEPRTKEMASVLKGLGIGKKCLVVTKGPNPNVVLAARNLPGVKTRPVHTLNTLDLLTYDHLLITVEAVKKAEELWAQERPRRKVPTAAGGGTG